jgi:hypothetical protein
VLRWADQGHELHIYLSALRPGERLSFPYRLEAHAACDVLQRPAQAYAYYGPEVRGQSGSTRLVARRDL